MRFERLTSTLGTLLMMAIGGWFVGGALIDLDLGTPRRLGPGAFPAAVGALLVVLAVAAAWGDLRRPVAPERFDPWSVLAVGGGVAAFAFITPSAGVLPAVFVSVLVTGAALRRITWLARLLLALVVTTGIWAIFVAGLQLPVETIRVPQWD